jgi:tetratricopeptide (TPR) repeat protein
MMKKAAGVMALIIMLSMLACGGSAKRGAPGDDENLSDPVSPYRAYDHFVKGDLYEQAGNPDLAMQEYKKALIYDPGSAEIRRALSELYFEQGKFTEAAVLRSEIEDKSYEDYNFIGDCLRYGNDFEGAADFYKRSLQLDSTQYVTRIYLAGLLFHLGDNSGAENNYTRAAELALESSEKINAYLELASFYTKTSKPRKAIEAYREAALVDPDDIRPALEMAPVYAAEGDTTAADSIYNSLIEKHANNLEVLNALISNLFAVERLDLAEKVARRTAELQPDNASLQRRYALIVFGRGDFPRAESLMVELDRKGMADGLIYSYLARILQDQDEFAKAEEYYNKSLALDDTLTNSWVNLAVVIDAQGRYEEAVSIMHKALEKNPADSIPILFYTAVIHARNDHFDLARDGYLRLSKSQPDNLDIRFNLAAVYERLGQFEESEREFKWIIEHFPDNALALNYLGYMYADRGVKLDEALKMIKKAVSLDPQNGAYLDSYAWVLYRLGRYEEALVQMKEALKYDRVDAVLFDHQGDIYAALDSYDLARESWARALELDPENEDIKAKLDAR